MGERVVLKPRLDALAREVFVAVARDAARNGVDAIDQWLDLPSAVALRGVPSMELATTEAAIRVLGDLLRQGWALDAGKEISATPPEIGTGDDGAERERIRAQEHLKRDEQLRTPAVRTFIRGMERQRLHRGRFCSIFNLMRDGRELVRSLADNGGDAVRPYVQAVTSDSRCEHTGLRLQDVWRYFRHTWANQYTKPPGRSMAFLVRDAAAPSHAVMGIFALGSSVVQIAERDRFLGWHPDVVVAQLQADPDPVWGRRLLAMLRSFLAEVYVDDFVRAGLLTPQDLR